MNVWVLSIAVYGQDTIPFRVTKYHNIIVKTLINDTDSLDLMFQIAMADASLSPLRSRKAESILFDTTAYKAGISRGNALRIEDVERTGILFFDNEHTGYEADGKIGTSLFAGKPFKIDYDKDRFVIYDVMPDTSGFDLIPLSVTRDQLFVPAYSIVDNEVLKHEFLLQSGYSGSILYDNTFSEENQLDKKLTFINEKTLQNSSGQRVVTKQGFVGQLRLGEALLDDVPVGVFVGEIKIQQVSYFGADLIRRFNWIIDIDRSIAYIQKSKYFYDPYYPMD